MDPPGCKEWYVQNITRNQKPGLKYSNVIRQCDNMWVLKFVQKKPLGTPFGVSFSCFVVAGCTALKGHMWFFEDKYFFIMTDVRNS